MPALPPFQVAVTAVTAAQLGASWHEGCPVGPSQLRLLRVSFAGFDGGAHTGTIVVHRDVAGDVTTVFRRLYAAGFPIHRMQPVSKYGGGGLGSTDGATPPGLQYPPAPAVAPQARAAPPV